MFPLQGQRQRSHPKLHGEKTEPCNPERFTDEEADNYSHADRVDERCKRYGRKLNAGVCQREERKDFAVALDY